jgi:hypothetical protein
MKQNGPGLFQVLPRHLAGGPEENYECPKSRYAMSPLRFEPALSRI